VACELVLVKPNMHDGSVEGIFHAGFWPASPTSVGVGIG
jgi:hypothetical protein